MGLLLATKVEVNAVDYVSRSHMFCFFSGKLGNKEIIIMRMFMV